VAGVPTGRGRQLAPAIGRADERGAQAGLGVEQEVGLDRHLLALGHRATTRTTRGSKRPGAGATNTIWRRPESITDESGTTMPAGSTCTCSTSTNIPGLSRRPGLSSSKRARRVRASRSSCGST
jgi:hypothetical protein